MRVEYDSSRDLFYMWFLSPGTKATETKTITPAVHADFDQDGKLIGIEVIDASEFIGEKIEFELPKNFTVTKR